MDEVVIHTYITSDCTSTTCGTTSMKKKSMSTELIDALREIVSHLQTPDAFSKEKMHFMEKDDVRKEQEFAFWKKMMLGKNKIMH